MTTAKIKKELIKEINRTRNNLSSCVCKQGYKDLISFVKKLGGKKDEQIKILFKVVDKLEQRISKLEKVLASHAKCIGEMREDKDE